MALPGNILSIDVEDWYQLTSGQLGGQEAARPQTLARQVDRLLELLNRRNTLATFFCLGKSLEHSPEIVRRIADAGHEIASHGWGHQPIHVIGLDKFREDLMRSVGWLGDLLGHRVSGYRAPAFSVTVELLDRFYDLCTEADLSYDSSVFPIRGRRYGIPGYPLAPTVVRDRDGKRLIELPLSALQWAGRRWPVAGGGYWRLLPGTLIRAAITRVNRERRPMVAYLHPYEFDRDRLDASVGGPGSVRAARRGLTQNLGRRSMYAKLDTILSRFRFTTAMDYLRDAKHL